MQYAMLADGTIVRADKKLVGRRAKEVTAWEFMKLLRDSADGQNFLK